MNYLYLFVFLLIAWIMAIYLLSPYIKKSGNFSLFGPALMLKFTKNRHVIDGIAKRFPAIKFSKVSVVIVFIAGIVSLVMLFYSAYLASFIRPSQAPPVTEFLGIPGINPAIPVGYGLLAIVISVVIHEMMHGITARKHGLKVDSVGALFFIVPVGAFVEPNQDEMTKADPVIRRRIFAAGPSINIIIGIIFAVILSTAMFAGAQPIHQGLYIESSDTTVNPHILPGTELISLGNYSGSAVMQALQSPTFLPGSNVTVETFDGHSVSKGEAVAGVIIVSVISGYPAEKVPGNSVILSIDNKTIYNLTTLDDVLNSIKPGTHISMKILELPSYSLQSYTMVTASKYSYYQQYDPSANSVIYKNQSFIGVSVSYMGISGYPLNELRNIIFLKEIYANPIDGFITSIGLPFYGLNPVPVSLASMFSVPVNPTLFWGTVNILFWMFWINIVLGITNALPFAFFDGGQFFKDTLTIWGRHIKSLRSEKTVNQVMYFLSFIVFFLILWEIVIPRII
ncbi:site-2 protease family protein [Thermoplasma volcanium]|nr:site-2 protease family protein [Thermoplasma volcanium]